jgi:hypothetical protein
MRRHGKVWEQEPWPDYERSHRDEVAWLPRGGEEPPVTRVIYATLDAQGVMVNVNKDASQGRATGSGK